MRPASEIAPRDADQLPAPPFPQLREELRLRQRRTFTNIGRARGDVCRGEAPLQVMLGDQLRQQLSIAYAGLRYEITSRKYERQ